TFMSRYIAALLDPVMPAPSLSAPVPEPASALQPPKPVAEPPKPIAEPARAVVEPPTPVAPPTPVPETPKPAVEPPKAIVEPPKPAAGAAPAAPKLDVKPDPKHDPKPAPAVEARDITELLRDFNLPGATEKASPDVAAHEPPPVKGRLGSGTVRTVALIAAAVIIPAGGGFYAWRAFRNTSPPVQMGSLSVQTNPPGAAVFVDGVAHGNTPARVPLKAGAHILELRG